MFATIMLILIALAWATWLFSGVFAKNKIVIFLIFSVSSVVSSYLLYQNLGSSEKLGQLTEMHQALKSNDLKLLLNKAGQEEITIETLFSEMRLRNELEPDNVENWMVFGRLLNQSGQLKLSEQSFQRAINLGGDTISLEVAQFLIENKQYATAKEKIRIVLLHNPIHEGALLLDGMSSFKMNKYQDAIYSWQALIENRGNKSESVNLIQQQIDLAKSKLADEQNNYLELVIDNFANLNLQSFTKAFALVRPAAGGAPIAVKSIEIPDLTKSIKITHDNLMLGGQNLWQVTDIYMEIRLSQNGFAKPKTGDIYGKTDTIKQITAGDRINLLVDQKID